MTYEIHLTVECDDIEKFKKDCFSLNVKPIIIDTTDQKQIMTSSKYRNDIWEEELGRLSDRLEKLNYLILRKKVEIYPEKIPHKNFIYYESHFRLKLPKKYNTDQLKDLCESKNFHFSRNLLKSDTDFNYQMITFRSNSINLDEFIRVIKDMELILDSMEINYDKIEIEECIYDSNQIIDNMWINKKKI